MTIFNNGFFAPVYELNMHYRHIATIDDVLLVRIVYCLTTGAKIVFHYEVTHESDGQLVLTAESVQLFTTTAGEFFLQEPDFYKTWKNRVLTENIPT